MDLHQERMIYLLPTCTKVEQNLNPVLALIGLPRTGLLGTFIRPVVKVDFGLTALFFMSHASMSRQSSPAHNLLGTCLCLCLSYAGQ